MSSRTRVVVTGSNVSVVGCPEAVAQEIFSPLAGTKPCPFQYDTAIVAGRPSAPPVTNVAVTVPIRCADAQVSVTHSLACSRSAGQAREGRQPMTFPRALARCTRGAIIARIVRSHGMPGMTHDQLMSSFERYGTQVVPASGNCSRCNPGGYLLAGGAIDTTPWEH